jgi:hypothetical protein
MHSRTCKHKILTLILIDTNIQTLNQWNLHMNHRISTSSKVVELNSSDIGVIKAPAGETLWQTCLHRELQTSRSTSTLQACIN